MVGESRLTWTLRCWSCNAEVGINQEPDKVELACLKCGNKAGFGVSTLVASKRELPIVEFREIPSCGTCGNAKSLEEESCRFCKAAQDFGRGTNRLQVCGICQKAVTVEDGKCDNCGVPLK